MNRRLTSLVAFLAVAVIGLAGTAGPLQAQAKKAEPPKPAKHEWEEALDSWSDIGRKLVAMAEDMPEAKYWYTPAKDTRTFGDMLLHVAGVNYQALNAIAGRELGPGANDPPRAKYSSKAAVVAYLKKSFADGEANLKAIKSHADFEKEVVYPWANQLVHPHSLWGLAVAHCSEHYGSLVTYYRLQGMVPPESRPRK